MAEALNTNASKAKPSYGGSTVNNAAVTLSEIPSKDTDQEPPRPQLSFKSNDDEILREVCLNNGINHKKLKVEGPEARTLEMFFSGFPRLIGMHHFPNLTTLTVIGQSVSRLEGLNALPLLEELWVAECQLTKIDGLQKCKNLTKLYLYGNKIPVIENIDHLTSLTVLWLNNNEIKNIENLHSLIKLRELNLAENLIEKIGSSLTCNSHLEDLNLSGNPLWSLRDLTCLVRMIKLMRLSLKDPLYHPCPASQLCNYSTHILYHLPNLSALDTLDITNRQLADLAEGTVNKKKMFYNMRAKTIKRNMSDLLARLGTTKKELMETPTSKLRVLNFVIKEMEREMELGGDENHPVPDACDSDPESERDVKHPEKSRTPYRIKLDALKQKRRRWETKINEMETYARASESRVRLTADVMINRLLVELETGGNVKFVDGQSSDAWFTSCHDLVLSRFCAYDYRDLGVVGIKIHRIVRIHNRMLRTRFDKSIINLTESNKGEYYPGVKNTAYKKSLEYLFWMSDPEMPGGHNESARIPEEGFLDGETYMKLGRDGAVPLSNSISLADRRRIAHCIKVNRDKEDIDNCPFRFGQLIVAKTHLGKSVVATDERQICKASYPKMDSVFRPRKNCIPKEKKSEENGCECSARQCEWYIFNNNLVLPEYIIEFEYVTRLKSRCPFQNLNEDLLSEQPAKPPKTNAVAHHEDHDSDSDSDIIRMEPEFKSRPRMVTLTDELILRAAKVDMMHKVTVLNLHGNGLTKLRHLQVVTNLKRLVVSFNELTRLDELSNMHIEYIDASFNKICTLDGMKGMTHLSELNVSWNKLANTREELSILRKHLGGLKVLDIRSNPWLKAVDLRLRAIGRLKNLQMLDGKRVEEEEAALAFRCAAGSRISQLSLLTHSRTDSTVPRSLSLGTCAHIISTVSRHKPMKSSENDASWYSQVTTLNLDNQHITKLSNLDRLESLQWVSFNNNDLTRIEGLDGCTQILELSLSNNCLAHLEGMSKLTRIQRLDLSHNCLTSLNTGALSAMSSLTSLSLESNKLTSLAGLQRATALVELYIGNNEISNIREVFLLKSLPNLVILDMYGNPMVSQVENYRLFVIYHLRSLKALDGTAIEAHEGNMAKDTFGGRLTPDFIAEKLGHSSFLEVRELDLPNCAIRTVDLGTGEQFINLRSVNLEHNNLQSFTGLIHLVNLRVLCLNHNHIECIVPKSKTTPSLKGGSRFGGNFPSKNVDYFAENCAPVLENLEVLHLGYNGIKDMAALQLSRLPSLKALFLQGNEIVKVEGLDGLHDLRELVLDRNKIKQLSEYSFINQWNLQELHLEENRLRDLVGLGCLENLLRLYLGSNRIQELVELDRLDTLHNLVEISLVNNAVARRLMHRVVLVHRLPRLAVIDGILITEEERNKAELYYADQTQMMTGQPPMTGLDSGLPGIGHYKPSVQVKVTNMQLSSPPVWGNTSHFEEETGQRGGGRNKRQTRDLQRQAFGLPGGGGANNTAPTNNNGRMQYTYLNQMPYSSSQTAEYVENIARMNQQRANKR
ncbi:leucine-rich repeat-containing protein 9 [Aplysia californica]|uniref:Leucine-rich repeat-containing protein 9 n=1 Tax=Aplysia californica TaxID=6500 RepID=A0ABM0JPA5_APLCA|nr:leucine-rich repeat-containing protein 9 [Aplysia californica]